MSSRLTINLTSRNLATGVGSVILGLAAFTWVFPMFLPPYLIYAAAGSVIGILGWFLYMLSRQEGV